MSTSSIMRGTSSSSIEAHTSLDLRESEGVEEGNLCGGGAGGASALREARSKMRVAISSGLQLESKITSRKGSAATATCPSP
eukprot:2446138-Pleurochrysis_carterae.AAC.1